ncbi:MAG: phosphatase PAP2 family protein [Rhodospirillaceae bacterium]
MAAPNPAVVWGYRLGRGLRWAAGQWRYWLPVVALAAFFLTFPGVDKAVSHWFYSEADGFYDPRGPGLEFIRMGVPALLYGILLFLALLWLLSKLVGPPLGWFTGRHLTFLAGSLFLGPGVIVNLILKEYWGRARPSQILDFGGSQDFTPAILIADQCQSNCSFVSGHAALGFWAVALALILPKCLPAALRQSALIAALVFGAGVGLARIVVGAHFLSDVLFSGIIVVGLTVWMHRKMFPR